MNNFLDKKFLVCITSIFLIFLFLVAVEELRFDSRSDFYYFEIEGYDPTELFRGHYIDLNFVDLNSQRVKDLHNSTYLMGSFFYTIFEVREENGLNVLYVDYFLKDIEGNQDKIYAHTQRNFDRISLIHFDNHYFKEKDRAKEIENILRDRNSKFYLKVLYDRGDFRKLEIVQINQNNQRIVIG